MGVKDLGKGPPSIDLDAELGHLLQLGGIVYMMKED